MASWHGHAREIVSESHTQSLWFFVAPEKKNCLAEYESHGHSNFLCMAICTVVFFSNMQAANSSERIPKEEFTDNEKVFDFRILSKCRGIAFLHVAE